MPDQRAELGLGALVCGVVVAAAGDVRRSSSAQAWPSFAHNGLGWFGSGGNVDEQIQAIFTSGNYDQTPRLHVPRLAADLEHDPDHGRRRWRSRSSARCSSPCSWSSSLPSRCKRMLEPVVRLLASVPSVIYGLIGVLVLVPFIGNHLITPEREGVGHAGDLSSAATACWRRW